MSMAAIVWARKSKAGGGINKSLLVLICSYSNETVGGAAWVGQDRLVIESEFGERTVRRALKELEDLGLIRRQRRFRKDGKPDVSLIYPTFDHRPNRPLVDAGDHRSEGPPVTEAAGAGEAVTTGLLGRSYHRPIGPPPPACQAANRVSDRKKDLAVAKSLPADTPNGASPDGENLAPKKRVRAKATSLPEGYPKDAFDRFWQAYPLHKDRANAQKAFIVAAWKVSFYDLMAAVERYAAETRGKDKIKYAQGWLSGERWTDESQPAPAAADTPDTKPSKSVGAAARALKQSFLQKGQNNEPHNLLPARNRS